MVTHPPSLFYTVSAQHRLNSIFSVVILTQILEMQSAKNGKITNSDIVWSQIFDGSWYHDKIKHNMGMERCTTIILVSTDSALNRQYKFTSLKKCKLKFTYRSKFPWEKRVQIYCKSLMVISLKQIKLWNGKRNSHGSGICRFSINQRREMHSIWKFRQILDICRLVWMRKRS